MSTGASNVFAVFSIDFDNTTNLVFHGGELLTGNLRIQLKRPMNIRAIKLQFKGRACWLQDKSKTGEVEKVYFDRDITLLERPPGVPVPGDFPWIADHLYSLPFECPLPVGCPTSYEGAHAFIRYFARALIEESAEPRHKYIVKKPFTIVSPTDNSLDIIDGQQSQHAVAGSETVAFGGCCCRGSISADVTLNKSLYCPGDVIYATIKVENNHPRHVVDEITVQLVDRVNRVQSASAAVSAPRVLIRRKIDKTAVPARGRLNRDNVPLLEVPAIAASTQDHVEQKLIKSSSTTDTNQPVHSYSTATLKMRKQPFIRISYALQILVGSRLSVELPITIGCSVDESLSSANYQPFVLGAQQIDETDDIDRIAFGAACTFAPLYPVLNVSAPDRFANGNQ